MLIGAGKLGFRAGRFAIGNPVGRIMAGTAIGGIAGAMSGDEFSSNNSLISKAMVGAAAGGMIGMGLNRAGLSVGRSAGMAGLRGARVAGIGAMRLARMPGMMTAGLATAGVGAGIYGIERFNRHRRLQRFQESTAGIVQGAHNGRHRG